MLPPPLYRLLNTPIIPQLPTHSSIHCRSAANRGSWCVIHHTHFTGVSHLEHWNVIQQRCRMSVEDPSNGRKERYRRMRMIREPETDFTPAVIYRFFSVFSYLNDRSRKTKFCIFAITRPMSVFSTLNFSLVRWMTYLRREATGIYGCSNRWQKLA